MTSLTSLNLQSYARKGRAPVITDLGLAHLRDLVKLESLNLCRARISDSGLAHLRPFTALRDLDLTFTGVTDSGLRYLRGLTKLERLKLGGTAVSEAGLERLRRELPRCSITATITTMCTGEDIHGDDGD
jgi:hypothetical protein